MLMQVVASAPLNAERARNACGSEGERRGIVRQVLLQSVAAVTCRVGSDGSRTRSMRGRRVSWGAGTHREGKDGGMTRHVGD